jgi:hypothetical protein
MERRWISERSNVMIYRVSLICKRTPLDEDGVVYYIDETNQLLVFARCGRTGTPGHDCPYCDWQQIEPRQLPKDRVLVLKRSPRQDEMLGGQLSIVSIFQSQTGHTNRAEIRTIARKLGFKIKTADQLRELAAFIEIYGLDPATVTYDELVATVNAQKLTHSDTDPAPPAF